MSSTVFTLRRKSDEKLYELQNKFLTEFENSTVEFEISYNHIETLENAEVLLLVCEKYFFRNGSMASLTLQCFSENNEQKAVVIGNGGGEGLMNFSWGANSSFAKKAMKILIGLGFTE